MSNSPFTQPEGLEPLLSSMARELLESRAWQEVSKSIQLSIAERMLGSAPNEAAKREALYYQANALFQIEAELGRLAAQKTSES